MNALIEPLQTGFTTFIEQLSGILTNTLTNANGSLVAVINAFIQNASEKLSNVPIAFVPPSFTIAFPPISFPVGDSTYSSGPLSTTATLPNVATGTIIVPGMFTGGPITGFGSRDSVPIMTSPGEFIMRRAAVDKYGSEMLSSMNAGSYSMPKYNIPQVSSPTINAPQNRTDIMAPVYNTYSVNVPVNQPGASADEIANKVITKIRNIDNMSVRSFRGY